MRCSTDNLIRGTLLLLLLVMFVPTSWAQRPERERRSRFEDARERIQERLRERRGVGSPLDQVLGGNPFERRRGDAEPLAEGEEDELRQFIEDHVPAAMQRRLSFIRRRNPDAFRQRAVPRLRQLKRVFEMDPELGGQMIEHMKNNEQLGQLRRQYQSEPEERERIRERIRALISENYQIETTVLAGRVQQMRDQRKAKVAELLALYEDPETNVSGSPAPVRDAIDAWRSASTDRDRRKLGKRLKELAQSRIDREIEYAEKRIAQRQEREPDAIDRTYDREIMAIERP